MQNEIFTLQRANTGLEDMVRLNAGGGTSRRTVNSRNNEKQMELETDYKELEILNEKLDLELDKGYTQIENLQNILTEKDNQLKQHRNTLKL